MGGGGEGEGGEGERGPELDWMASVLYRSEGTSQAGRHEAGTAGLRLPSFSRSTKKAPASYVCMDCGHVHIGIPTVDPHIYNGSRHGSRETISLGRGAAMVHSHASCLISA